MPGRPSRERKKVGGGGEGGATMTVAMELMRDTAVSTVQH